MSTTSQAFFEQKYRDHADPWDFASSSYELARYDAVLGALAGRRFTQGFEPACSIGVLTEKLAAYCDRLDAIDLSPTAVARARERCSTLTNVNIQCASLAEHIPPFFDLLVFCEVGYYFPVPELRDLLGRCVESLASDGTLVACHWLGTSPDHILTGDEVHAELAQISSLQLEHAERHSSFRLERWRKTPTVSR